MTRYVAFLRAINVGGHTVKMDRLRELFEALRFSSVATFIASGNVVFGAGTTAPEALEARIESRLAGALGYDVATFVRPVTALPAIVVASAFATPESDADANRTYVGFLRTAPTAEGRRRLDALGSALNEFHLHGREVYWLCRTRFSDSAVSGATLEKALGTAATFRNMTTVRKLADRFAGA